MGSESYTPDRLFAGDFPVQTVEVTIASGAGELARGCVLGKIDTGGKCVAVDDSLSNGAEAPYAVLAEEVDASAADVVATAYRSGDFNEDELTFGDDDVIGDHRDAMRAKSMFTHTPLDAAGIDD